MATIPIPDIAGVWRLRRDEFNEWRATNDLPELLKFFEATLPSFADWLSASGISNNEFCRVVPTSDLFEGDEKRIFIESHFDRDKYKFWELLPISKEQLVSRHEESGTEIPPHKEVEPYFAWAKRTLGSNRYFSVSPGSKAKTDRIIFNSWTAFDVPNASRAKLLGQFEVLKLGGVTLSRRTDIGGRNLAFADLDHTTIEGEWHGSIFLRIGFSSCKHFRFKDAKMVFWRMSECHLDNFCCDNSDLYDFEFVNCSGSDQKMVDSQLRQVSFIQSIVPELVHCELSDFLFVPPLRFTSNGKASTYRRIRSAYQQSGKRQEASEAYYLERTFERKGLFNIYGELRSRPPSKGALKTPPSKFGGSFRDILTGLEKADYPREKALEFAISKSLFHIRCWLPPYLFQTIRYKLRWIISFLENILWGYGERPVRTLVVSAAVILGFSAIYFLHMPEIDRAYPSGDLLDSVYFSAVTFTTVGFGDVLPKSTFLKTVAGLEAFIGVFLIGLSIAGFSNRARY